MAADKRRVDPRGELRDRLCVGVRVQLPYYRRFRTRAPHRAAPRGGSPRFTHVDATGMKFMRTRARARALTARGVPKRVYAPAPRAAPSFAPRDFALAVFTSAGCRKRKLNLEIMAEQTEITQLSVPLPLFLSIY